MTALSGAVHGRFFFLFASLPEEEKCEVDAHSPPKNKKGLRRVPTSRLAAPLFSVPGGRNEHFIIREGEGTVREGAFGAVQGRGKD